MLYATDTVLALHRARSMDEQRSRRHLEQRGEHTAPKPRPRIAVRFALAR